MKLIVALSAVLFCSHVASADIIDFEDGSPTGFPPGLLSAVTPVTVGDFIVSAASNAEITNNLNSSLGGNGPASRGLFAMPATASMTLTITRVGGALFEFVGLDWGFDSVGVGAATVLGPSTVAGGAFTDVIVAASAGIDTGATFNTFSATTLAGQSITSLDISFSGTSNLAPGFFGLDNIEVNPVGASVPEPSSFALLVLGGFGYWGVRRRRKPSLSTSV